MTTFLISFLGMFSGLIVWSWVTHRSTEKITKKLENATFWTRQQTQALRELHAAVKTGDFKAVILASERFDLITNRALKAFKE